MSAAPELHVAPSADEGLALRWFTVTASDGTELQAWTNDVAGPTVLLCNGLGTNPYCWPALLDPGCGVHVVSWNHRGTGGSQRPADPERVDIEDFAADAIAVMDHEGIEACVLMGWSMGVNTMFEVAVTHPERVTGLFAVGGVPGDTFSSMGAPLMFPRPVRKPIAVTMARLMKLTGRP
ncbi:MAG: alpha/beta fold hydrolase, partial [Marmoricola sp.]|nr:alpha/beta fold hydrolase [Marmoricola sp.]